MRKIYFLALVTFAALTSCEKSNPVYTIEGKWIWSPSESRADANTIDLRSLSFEGFLS